LAVKGIFCLRFGIFIVRRPPVALLGAQKSRLQVHLQPYQQIVRMVLVGKFAQTPPLGYAQSVRVIDDADWASWISSAKFLAT
jgi:hypothetical protein